MIAKHSGARRSAAGPIAAVVFLLSVSLATGAQAAIQFDGALFHVYPVGPDPNYVEIGDVSGDGRPDLVVINSGATVSVLLGRGDGTFDPKTDYATSPNPRSVAIADFNGDGKPDLA